MLNLVIITYNDMPLLQNCIESVLGHVDRVVVVDGIFEDFPCESEDLGYSRDGTLEYLQDLEADVSLAIVPGLSEVEKRSLYLIGEPGDWYLHLDADERVLNPEELSSLPDADVGLCHMAWENQSHWYPRLFRHVDGVHYEGLHHRLVDGEGNHYVDIYGTGEGYTSVRHSLKIWHDRSRRPHERERAKGIYYARLTEKERPVKEMLRYG